MIENIDYKTQLDRLHKHYLTCVRSPDKVALLDLSHSLRIWNDIKNSSQLFEIDRIKSRIFKYISLPKELCEFAKSSYSILTYLPNNTYTYAHNGSIASGGKLKPGKPFWLSAKANADNKDILFVYNYIYIEKCIDDELRNQFKNINIEIQKTNFKDWMKSEILRIYHIDDVPFLSISREKIITRMANAFDGSHPRTTITEESNIDKILGKMLEYTIGDLPLPYFLLISIGKEVLNNMPIILNIEDYKDILK